MINAYLTFCIIFIFFGVMGVLYCVFEWARFYISDMLASYQKKHKKYRRNKSNEAYATARRESRYRY